MADAGRYVFRASKDAHAQLTRLFDFIHPTAIAMWNLRWQVQGFLANVPNASSKELGYRFALGTDLNAGALKRSTVETPWTDQLERFASIILITTISIFEDFTDSIASGCSHNREHRERFAKALQFPSRNGTDAVSLAGNRSFVMDRAVMWDEAILRRYLPSGSDDLLKCYRFFKEVRNALAHNGGRANQRMVDAYKIFADAIKDDRIGGAAVPDHSPISNVGDVVKITYRGVVGFSEIVLRIITYYDLTLCEYELVEHELKMRLTPDIRFWPSDEKAKLHRIGAMFRSQNFPSVTVTTNLRNFLFAHNLIPGYAASR